MLQVSEGVFQVLWNYDFDDDDFFDLMIWFIRLNNNSLPWCVGVLIKEVSKGNKEIYVKIRYWDKKRIMS